jgi:hypothetical protein
MKTYTIIFYHPWKEERNTPYTSEKSASRHDDFIWYFPKNTQFYLSTFENQYKWNETFSPKYKRNNNNWEETNETIYADLILWFTGRINAQNIYHNPIRELCINKTHIEKIFPQYTFSSQVCENYSDIVTYFDTIPSEIKVLKPYNWSQAIGIHITRKLPEKSEILWDYPYLLQEFIDTSHGFGEYPWIHDFRTIIINGEITGSFLRIAPKWVMTANVATWAEIVDFWIWNIPPNIEKIIQEIDTYCSEKYPQRYYSIDIGVWNNWEIKIFELNSSPMLSTSSIRKWLAQHIIKNILKIS